jgi:hypothetical protein
MRGSVDDIEKKKPLANPSLNAIQASSA